MLSLYRIPPNSYKSRLKTSFDDTHCERDVKRPQMTPKDLN